MANPRNAETRCGFVAVIGAPNSGKSTLTNALVGAKVSIVTHKAQTTRGPVRGIALIGKAQVILVDTPGIFQPKRRLDRAMAQAAWERAGDADLVALVIDAKSVLQEWAQGRRLPLPRYLEVAREGPDHAPRFTAEVQVEGVAPERGQGANKQAAEQAAALALLLREGVWQAPQDG